MSISRDHHSIINELMKVSGYQNNDAGNCKGIALVGLEDEFAGKFQSFEMMMDYIISTPLNKLKIECLNKDSLLALFLKRINLFQYKSHASDILFTRLIVPGMYSLPKLKTYLQILVNVAEASQFNHLLGLSLASGNHAISSTYHRESKAFLFINANLKPKPFIVIYDIDEVVKLIRAAFFLISNDQKSLFSTTIHTIKSNNDLVEKNIIDTMALLDNTLSPMHEPTAEDACYVDPVTNVNLAWIAARERKIELIKKLKTLGANIHQVNNEGASSLYIACERGHLDVVKFLIEQGANIHQRANAGDSPLYIACYNGHLDIVKFLITQGANIHQPNNTGASPLYVACQNGYLDVVKFLITQGANIHQPTNSGWSPLRVAIENEQFHAFNCLVENGANINLINFTHIYLLGANLANANLSQKNLTYARLIRTDLSNANLSHAYLYRANLANSNLSGANIIGADLTEASLHGVENNIFIINPNANARRLNESVRFLPVTEQRKKMSTSQIKSEILLALWHAYNLLKSDQDHTQACAIKNLIEMSNKDENKSIIDDINQWKYSNARFFCSHGLGIYTLEFINNLTRHAEVITHAGNKRKFANEDDNQKPKQTCLSHEEKAEISQYSFNSPSNSMF
jgi:ankyrin repeat protein